MASNTITQASPVEMVTTELQQSDNRMQPLQQIVSATLGGTITALIVTPLDVVKTRMQSQKGIPIPMAGNKVCYIFYNGLMTHVCKSCNSLVDSESLFSQIKEEPKRGIPGTFAKIICEEGLLALWSGLGPTLVSALPAAMIYFVTYDQLKYKLKDFYYDKMLQQADTAPRPMPTLVPLIAAVSARSFAVGTVTPIEMVRIKMQAQKMTYTQASDVLRNLVQTSGVRSLWRGLPPTLMRDLPFSSVYWSSYEGIKRTFELQTYTYWQSFLAGASCGALATVLTMPFDVITTRTQIELGWQIFSKDAKGNVQKPPSPFARLGRIYREGGFRSLYVGLTPRLMRVVPSCAIMISTFETVNAKFRAYNTK